MASSSVTNVPSGVGGSTYYGAMGGPTGRVRSGLPFAYDTLAPYPGNLSWPRLPIVWDGGSDDPDRLTIDGVKKHQELLAAAEKSPLALQEIQTELTLLRRLAERALQAEPATSQPRELARGHLIAALPALEKCLLTHQRKGSSVTAPLALLEELKRIQKKL